SAALIGSVGVFVRLGKLRGGRRVVKWLVPTRHTTSNQIESHFVQSPSSPKPVFAHYENQTFNVYDEQPQKRARPRWRDRRNTQKELSHAPRALEAPFSCPVNRPLRMHGRRSSRF